MQWMDADEIADRYSVLIVGAGPGGLSAANALSQIGPVRPDRVLVVDGGRMHARRARGTSDEVTCGYGGAGLFSDGKFSFYPSASELWDLPDKPALRDAYGWMTSMLAPWGIAVPPLTVGQSAPAVRSQWFLKKYPSEYLSLDDRMQLIEMLVNRASCSALEQVRVTSCSYERENGGFRIELADVADPERRKSVIAERLIVATGRFGPLQEACMGFAGRIFRRMEVGIRIEQQTKHSFFHALDTVDPKFRFVDEDGKVEWRTFCACRDGATVLADTLGVWSVSGHSDCPPTGFSNCGFNTRILDERIASETWQHLLSSLRSKASHFALPLQSVLECAPEAAALMKEVYGELLYPYILRGLKRLTGHFPVLASASSRIIGPTLEGVGWYPELEETLKVPGMPAWIIGDASGKFRGITAAMLSGHYVGQQLVEEQPLGDVGVRRSNVRACRAE